jgi:hypothetical protein
VRHALLATALLAAIPAYPARAENVVIDAGGALPLGLGVQARLGRGGISISLSPRRVRARRRGPPPRRRPPAPVSAPRPRDRGVPVSADPSCLAALQSRGAPFVAAGAVRGIETPIEITGPLGGIRLLSRSRRAPLMDCELARSLLEAAPFLRELGISGLSFSGTYQYRTVKGTSKLSGHAHGLAIDVHAVETAMGSLDVERDYARDAGRWQAGDRRRQGIASCVGDPPTPQGRLLRALACGLRSQRSLRLVLGPDDNYDHRNHLHIEAHPGPAGDLVSGSGSGLRWGRSGR